MPTILVEGRWCGGRFRFDLGLRHRAHGECQHQNHNRIYAAQNFHFFGFSKKTQALGDGWALRN
jgi:hypothetical protein